MTESKAVPMTEQLLVPKVVEKKVGGIWKKWRGQRGGEERKEKSLSPATHLNVCACGLINSHSSCPSSSSSCPVLFLLFLVQDHDEDFRH